MFNWNLYKKRLRSKSIDSLLFTINDCEEAIKENPDNEKNSHYREEIRLCKNELQQRKQ